MPLSSAFPSTQVPPRRQLTRSRSSIIQISDTDQDRPLPVRTGREKSEDRPTISRGHRSQYPNRSRSRERAYNSRKVTLYIYYHFYSKMLTICAWKQHYLSRDDSVDVHEHCHRKFDRLQGKYDMANDEHSKLRYAILFWVAIC